MEELAYGFSIVVYGEGSLNKVSRVAFHVNRILRPIKIFVDLFQFAFEDGIISAFRVEGETKHDILLSFAFR